MALKLLLVEDDPALQDAMQLLLRQWGTGLELAGGGAEAMGWLEQERCDPVVLTLGLPDSDSSKVAQVCWPQQQRQRREPPEEECLTLQ